MIFDDFCYITTTLARQKMHYNVGLFLPLKIDLSWCQHGQHMHVVNNQYADRLIEHDLLTYPPFPDVCL